MGESPINSVESARVIAVKARQSNALRPYSWDFVPRKFRHTYANAWNAEDLRLKDLAVQKYNVDNTTGDPFLRRVLRGTYGGPSISIENGEWVLYTWGDAPVSDEVICSHRDWDEFLKLVEAYYHGG